MIQSLDKPPHKFGIIYCIDFVDVFTCLCKVLSSRLPTIPCFVWFRMLMTMHTQAAVHERLSHQKSYKEFPDTLGQVKPDMLLGASATQVKVEVRCCLPIEQNKCAKHQVCLRDAHRQAAETSICTRSTSILFIFVLEQVIIQGFSHCKPVLG